MKVADQVAAFIAEQGLKRVFGIPGTENLPLMESLGDRGVDYVLVSHENAAAFMADATAYLTGQLQACIVTRGPGGTNIVSGAASAHLDGSPVLVITGQVEKKRLEHFRHQILDLDALYAPLSKGSYYLTAENAAETLGEAASLALAERPGVVRLGLSGGEASREAVGSTSRVEPAPVPAPEDAVLEAVAGQVRASQRPFLLLGGEVWSSRQMESAQRLAERLGAPVAVTVRAKGVFPETHPNYCGVICTYQDPPIHAVVEQSDLVLAVGVDGGEFFVDWKHKVPVCSLSSGNGDAYFQRVAHARGNLGFSLSRLADLPSRENWGEAPAARCRAQIEHLFEEKVSTPGALSPQGLCRVLRDALPRDVIVTSDVGSHKLVMGQIWRASRPGHFIASSTHSSMGGGVPAGIAAALEVPETPVVAVTGDGGMLMSAGELATLGRTGVPLLVVVFNDRTLSSIRRKQEVAGYKPAGINTGETSFTKLAEAFSIPAARATTESEVVRALEQWRASGKALLLEAMVDFAHYRPMGY